MAFGLGLKGGHLGTPPSSFSWAAIRTECWRCCSATATNPVESRRTRPRRLGASLGACQACPRPLERVPAPARLHLANLPAYRRRHDLDAHIKFEDYSLQYLPPCPANPNTYCLSYTMDLSAELFDLPFHNLLAARDSIFHESLERRIRCNIVIVAARRSSHRCSAPKRSRACGLVQNSCKG